MPKTLGEIKNKNNNIECKAFLSFAKSRINNIKIHKHREFEISLIIDGKGKYETNSKKETISSGDIFIFQTNEQHCISDIEKNNKNSAYDMLLFNLHISPAFFWDFYDYNNKQNSYLRLVTQKNILISNKINKNFIEYEKFSNILYEIKSELENDNYDKYKYISIKIMEFIILLNRVYCKNNINKQNLFPFETIEKIENSAEFLNNNYDHEISLSELSNIACMSRTYFSSAFKKIYGLSPWEYLSIKRIEEAKKLLKTSDENIIDIANKCGYNNSVNFIKTFKKYTNTLPKDYKKNN